MPIYIHSLYIYYGWVTLLKTPYLPVSQSTLRDYIEVLSYTSPVSNPLLTHLLNCRCNIYAELQKMYLKTEYTNNIQPWDWRY
jgi:hypothetical protein